MGNCIKKLLEVFITVLVRVLPRHRTCIYKELAHITMEVGRLQDLWGELASGEPQRADDVVYVQRPAGLRPRRCPCFSSTCRQE